MKTTTWRSRLYRTPISRSKQPPCIKKTQRLLEFGQRYLPPVYMRFAWIEILFGIVGIDTVMILYLKKIVFLKRNTHLKLNCVFHFFFHTLLSTWHLLFNRKKPRSSPIPSQYIQARLVSLSTWMKDVMNRMSPPPQYKWVALSRLRKMWRTAHTTPLGYLNLPPLGKRGICSVKIRWDWFVWFNTCCPYNVFYQLI